MYSRDKTNIALQVYHQCGPVTNTIRMLGYPTRRALYTWIENEGVQKTPRKVLDNTNTATHPRNPPAGAKMDAIHRCFELGESIKYVPEEIGYSRASIYAWRKKYLQEGTQDPPNAEMQVFARYLFASADKYNSRFPIFVFVWLEISYPFL